MKRLIIIIWVEVSNVALKMEKRDQNVTDILTVLGVIWLNLHSSHK